MSTSGGSGTAESAGRLSDRVSSMPVTVIEPDRGWFDWRLGQLWRYRDLVGLFVWRDFASLYKQTILGPIWHIVHPLVTSVVFTVVFGRVAQISTGGAPHFVFYLAGMVAWTYFANCVTNTANTFIGHAPVLGKVYFHRLVIPVSMVLSNLVSFGIQFGIFAVVLVVYMASGAHVAPTVWAFWSPLLLLMLAGYGFGIGIIVTALTVKYRDLKFLVTYGVNILLYLTPVIYPTSALPPSARWVARLNPLAPLIEGFRRAFLGTGGVSAPELAVSFGLLLVVLAVGLTLFTRVERTFIDTV